MGTELMLTIALWTGSVILGLFGFLGRRAISRVDKDLDGLRDDLSDIREEIEAMQRQDVVAEADFKYLSNTIQDHLRKEEVHWVTVGTICDRLTRIETILAERNVRDRHIGDI